MTNKYVVYVDDNFHYQDDSKRYKAGEFNTLDRSIAKCRAITRESLGDLVEGAKSTDDLILNYVMFGDDPWVSSPTKQGGVSFSAREFARQIAEEVFRSQT